MCEKIEERKFELNCGCTLHCLASGPAAGQAIVMLHGMKFQAETWRELGTIALLARQGYRVFALDLPGFGKSSACNAATDTVLAEFLLAAGLNNPVLVGPSMGGRVSLEFSLGHPEQIGGLVLVGAVGVRENMARLGRLRLPCLVVWGGEDAVSPIENADILAENIPGARKVIIAGAPHPCYLAEPRSWHNAILTFMKERF